MFKTSRKLNLGWIVILIGIITILSGLSMTEENSEEKTLLCFDIGCVYFQNVANTTLGSLFLSLGLFFLTKEHYLYHQQKHRQK